jgi:hypothetical protein
LGKAFSSVQYLLRLSADEPVEKQATHDKAFEKQLSKVAQTYEGESVVVVANVGGQEMLRRRLV